jgi:hypothetical protein
MDVGSSMPSTTAVARRSRIAIVATHFGRSPIWLPAFLLSCRENPHVRWLIYTDIDVPDRVPGNVEITPMTLEEFNQRCSDALGAKMEVRRASLPKISDFKPAYGVIFADELRPFEFWAYSELDIIWGAIDRFITDRLLDEHDLVSSRHFELGGHFTLFRNNERMNRLFEIMPDAIASMSHPHHFRLDEREFTNRLLALAADPAARDCPRLYWDHPDLTMSAQYQRGLPDGPGGNLWWCRGRTYDAEGNELMYLHFHKLKNHMKTINFRYEDRPATFLLNRSGVYRRTGSVQRG